MPNLDFAEAIDLITSEEIRYDRDAYYFLREALDLTVKQRKKSREAGGERHVTGQQLLEGIRLHALKEFGPMVVTVFAYWGIQQCEDFGQMVYQLIRTGVFGKTDTDSIDDFRATYTFEDAFVTPFRPEIPMAHRRAIVPDEAAENLN